MTDYLIKFRRARTLKTLEMMADKCTRLNPLDDMEICKAFVERDKEIERGVQVDDKTAALMAAFREA